MFEQELVFAIIATFVVTILFAPAFIPFLRRLKFGQNIREDGPQEHHKKAGTPTMGGIIFLLSAIVMMLVFSSRLDYSGKEVKMLVLVTVGFAVLGFIDDFIKVVLKRNTGLTSKQKFIGQVLIAIIFCYFLYHFDHSTVISFEMVHFSIDLKWLYPFFVIFYLVGFSNATNLTDGLDGLVSGTAAIAFGAFAIIAWNLENYVVALFCVTIVGAVLGFLVFNAHPAKVFMGDTGSLALGGAIATVAILLKKELLLVIIGGVFVIETLSVMLQVVSFKSRGKRIFKMAPIHHHYELSGWSEWRVVTTFWTVGLLFAILGIYIEVWLS